MTSSKFTYWLYIHKTHLLTSYPTNPLTDIISTKSIYWLHIRQIHLLTTSELHIHEIHLLTSYPTNPLTSYPPNPHLHVNTWVRSDRMQSFCQYHVSRNVKKAIYPINTLFRNCNDVIPCRSYSFVIVFVLCIVSLWDLRSCDCMHILESGVILRYFVGELSHFLVEVLFWESKRDISHFENPYIALRKRIASDILICHVKPYDPALYNFRQSKKKIKPKKKNR